MRARWKKGQLLRTAEDPQREISSRAFKKVHNLELAQALWFYPPLYMAHVQLYPRKISGFIVRFFIFLETELFKFSSSKLNAHRNVLKKKQTNKRMSPFFECYENFQLYSLIACRRMFFFLFMKYILMVINKWGENIIMEMGIVRETFVLEYDRISTWKVVFVMVPEFNLCLRKFITNIEFSEKKIKNILILDKNWTKKISRHRNFF